MRKRELLPFGQDSSLLFCSVTLRSLACRRHRVEDRRIQELIILPRHRVAAAPTSSWKKALFPDGRTGPFNTPKAGEMPPPPPTHR